MKTEYHKWWSPSLGQDMELKVYGFYGKPMLVFPAQASRFDIWGGEVNHDWPWWLKMLPYFLEKLELTGYSPHLK